MASGIGSYHCDMADIAKSITMNVVIHGRRRYRVRTWIATRLIQLAARIMRMEVRFAADASESEQYGLRALLKELEYANEGDCPICGVFMNREHNAGCRLAAAIRPDHGDSDA